jgi:hypothetical protein
MMIRIGRLIHSCHHWASSSSTTASADRNITRAAVSIQHHQRP